MASVSRSSELKERIQDFWNADPCGSRYLEGENALEHHADERYRLEPHIRPWARFVDSPGKRVLEIGVGMGADYLEWLKNGAIATGIDLSPKSIEKARTRCESAGHKPDLRVADAEQLPFPEGSFDVVYSYGVLHHSPDTARCIREARRVLKPGGEARIMLYQHPSLTGLMLWLRYGWFRGKSIRQSVYDHLESPGTKTFTRAEVQELMKGWNGVTISSVFSPGDLLLHRPSAAFQSRFYKPIWKLYPRWIVRRIAKPWGLFLLISARKPQVQAETIR
jgi:ubiquinone/menaquinone biosynthesis C-methylase UbiE